MRTPFVSHRDIASAKPKPSAAALQSERSIPGTSTKGSIGPMGNLKSHEEQGLETWPRVDSSVELASKSSAASGEPEKQGTT